MMKRRIKTFLGGSVLALALIGVAVAGPLEDAMAALQRGDYAVAMRLFRPLAEQGDVDAHRTTRRLPPGFARPPIRAMPARRPALARLTLRGVASVKTVDKPSSGSARPLTRDAFAECALGLAYMEGEGIQQDLAQGASWLRKAADQGNAPAQNLLGAMYAEGKGVRQDYVQAHMWFNLSASRATDVQIRDLAAKQRDQLAAKMTPDQIAEAQRLAREWKPK